MQFDADKVIALKIQKRARRLEIRVADDRGAEHVMSLPIPAAIELAQFILDAERFMKELKARGSREEN